MRNAALLGRRRSAVVFALYHVFMGPSPLNLFGKLVCGIILGATRALGFA